MMSHAACMRHAAWPMRNESCPMAGAHDFVKDKYKCHGVLYCNTVLYYSTVRLPSVLQVQYTQYTILDCTVQTLNSTVLYNTLSNMIMTHDMIC